MNRYVLVLMISLLAGFQSAAAAHDSLDDATILAIFDQANTLDIWTARIGVANGHSAKVRALGKMVATDHETVQQMGRDLAKKLGIIPTPPAQDDSAARHAKAIALLQSKSGKEFDQAYLQHEMAFHDAVIKALRHQLLPSAKNAELRALLEKVLPGFEHHLAATLATAKELGIE